MKKLLLIPLLILFGCSDPVKSRQSIIEQFRTTDVAQVPDNHYAYIVRDTNGAVWYVTVNSGPPESIRAQTKIFNEQR